jgi:hypothetical protein
MSHYNRKRRPAQPTYSLSLEDFVALIAQKTNHEPKRRGSEFFLRCPAHEDKNPSLSTKKADDAKILVYCFAGCSVKAICDSIGISSASLFPPKE